MNTTRHSSHVTRHRAPERCRIKMLGTDGDAVWLVGIEGETVSTTKRMQKAPAFEYQQAQDLYVQLTRMKHVREPELVPELNANC